MNKYEVITSVLDDDTTRATKRIIEADNITFLTADSVKFENNGTGYGGVFVAFFSKVTSVTKLSD